MSSSTVEVKGRPHRKSDPSRRAVDPLIGAHIEGRYIVERIQGRGGTSVVYAGIHEELQREVAIKVLDEASAKDPEAVERFVFEARMGSSIAHGNVVGVSDFGHLPDGRPFLVMPMVAGTDMATLLAKEGPQHPRRVAALLKGVAAALGLMHARGIVHRDIKSENLMHVAHEDGTETILVLDFGITASRVDQDDEYDASGTPEFMPPEALNGELFDYRGDIYSLATVAFEMIAGGLPFDGDDPISLRKKKMGQPPRTLTQVSQTEFPIGLEAVLARGLATRPEDRQASANDFVRELEAAADLVPDLPGYQLPPRKKRMASSHPTLVGTGAPMPTRVKRKIVNGVEQPAPSRAPAPARTTLTAAARAARFSSSTPAPPPLGSTELTKVQVPSFKPPPRIAAETDADSGQWQAEPSFESGVRPLPQESKALRREAEARDATKLGANPLAPAAGSGPSLPRAVVERKSDPELDEAMFRPRVFDANRVVYLLAAGIAVVAIAMWGRHRMLTTAPAPAPSALAPIAAGAPTPPPAVEAPMPGELPPELAPRPAVAPVPAPEPAAASVAVPVAVPVAAAPARAKASSDRGRRGKSTAPSRRSRADEPPAPEPAAAPAPAPAAAPVLTAKPNLSVVSVRAASDPARARELADQGTAATLRGDFSAAAAAFQQAIAADAGYAPAFRGKALALERLGRTQDAITAFRQFLKLAPNGPSADTVRARLQALESSR
jgi:serine/threonine protein kinase